MVLLATAASAAAAPTTALTGAALTVTGEDVAETFTISRDAGLNLVEVTGPAGMNDPDGAGTTCSASQAGTTGEEGT